MLSRGAVATMAALSTACRGAAFVPTFASNAAMLGSGRARHFMGAAAPIGSSAFGSSRRRVRGSTHSSSGGGSSLALRPGRRAGGIHRSGVRTMMMMMSSAQDTAAVETLTANIKAKGDEIRR